MWKGSSGKDTLELLKPYAHDDIENLSLRILIHSYPSIIVTDLFTAAHNEAAYSA